MDALAQHETNGGDLKAVLERVARGQRSQLRLHSRIAAQQAGARLVGRVYAAAPLCFLLFMRFMGGDSYARFFLTPFGQAAQLLVLGSGLAAWWLTDRIARRGIYLDDNPAVPRLAAQRRGATANPTGAPPAVH
jgi:Flp pilus assembly protein TadB